MKHETITIDVEVTEKFIQSAILDQLIEINKSLQVIASNKEQPNQPNQDTRETCSQLSWITKNSHDKGGQ